MSRLAELLPVRRLAPWLLFFAWLAISAAQLWVREIDAVRRGVLGCFSPARPETAARSRALTDWFPGRLTNGNPRAPIDRIPKSGPRQHPPEESGERIS